jgi:S1-C subfamily serine protease
MLDVERRYGIFTGLTTQEQPQEPCVVSEVAAGSPAALVGIRSGDVVKRLGGRAIVGRCEFLLSLVGRKPSQSLELDLERSDRTVHASLTLAGRPKPDGALLLRQRYGLTAAPLSEAKAQETSLRVHRGVVITAVIPGAPYNTLNDNAKPLPGDVLARINSIRPRDLDQVGLLLDAVKPGEPVHFVLLRMKDRVATRIDIVLTLTK